MHARAARDWNNRHCLVTTQRRDLHDETLRATLSDIVLNKMPSFDFSKYVKRNSVTEFSDLNPQAEWEERQRARGGLDNTTTEQSVGVNDVQLVQSQSSAAFFTPSSSSVGSRSQEWRSDTSFQVDQEVNNLLMQTSYEIQRQRGQGLTRTGHVWKESNPGGNLSSSSSEESKTSGFGSFRDVVFSNYQEHIEDRSNPLNENHNRGPSDQYKEGQYRVKYKNISISFLKTFYTYNSLESSIGKW